MAQTVTVTLGGRTYTIRRQPIGPAARWRQKLAGPFAQVASTLANWKEIELSKVEDVASLLQVVGVPLIGSVDLVVELLFEYAPELQADRERIEAEAFDDEALAAFVEVLKLAYPFSQLAQMIQTIRKPA